MNLHLSAANAGQTLVPHYIPAGNECELFELAWKRK